MASASNLAVAVHEKRPRARWRWWILVVGLIVGYGLITENKPQRYRDEDAVMEEIARVLRSPVAYQRDEGWSWAPYVTTVYLPRVALDEGTTHDLARLLGRLPKLRDVVTHYVEDQQERVEQLRRELGHPFSVHDDLGASSEEKDSRQKRTYVAGVFR